MREQLTYKLTTQLHPDDAQALKILADHAECNEHQLARYVLRRFIAEKLAEARTQTHG